MAKQLKQLLFSSRGFTLIEMLLCVAIIGILIAIAIPVFSGALDSTKTAVLDYNCKAINNLITYTCLDYDKENWFDTYNNNGDGSVNNYIEQTLETKVEGHYSNNINLVNPISDNTSILDYYQTVSSGDGYLPALFLTDASSWSYAGTGSTDNILGTIVAYFDDDGSTTDHIEVYYINEDGTKSDTCYTIS